MAVLISCAFCDAGEKVNSIPPHVNVTLYPSGNLLELNTRYNPSSKHPYDLKLDFLCVSHHNVQSPKFLVYHQKQKF